MADPTLTITVEQNGDVSILSLAGPIDSATFDQFKTALHERCKAGGSKCVLNCADLTYMNSKSLGLLAQYHRQCMASMGYLALCCLNRKIVKTMDLLGLGRSLKIFDSLDEAIEAVG